MRAILLCCALLLTALPVASAHDEDPPASPDLFSDDGCVLLPLYDWAMCAATNAGEAADEWSAWGGAMVNYAGHVVGCHVVGGPACVA